MIINVDEHLKQIITYQRYPKSLSGWFVLSAHTAHTVAHDERDNWEQGQGVENIYRRIE